MICIATDWQKDTYLTKSSAYQKIYITLGVLGNAFFRIEYSTDQKVVQNKTNKQQRTSWLHEVQTC